MVSPRSYFSFIFALGLFVTACDKPRPVAAESKPKPSIQLAPVPRSRVADDTARFFAALPAKPGSAFEELEKGEVWLEYKRQMDAAWAKTDVQLLQGLREFQAKELSLPIVENRTVFYPFSGPDTMTPMVYFPRNPLYIMVALEPAGTLPSVAQIEKNKDLPKYLANMRETMGSILGRSFFVTREMDRQFRGQDTDGLMLPILHLLARTNHTILGVRYVRIEDDGEIVERPAVYQTSAKYGNRGIEVEFESAPNAPSQRLYYFSVNLDDRHMEANSGFRAFLTRVTDTLSMFKATSYMTHQKEFSAIREHVLAHSDLVIQDDSGIPYHFFTPDQWQVQLYGDYVRPYGSFRFLEQKDLRTAFQTESPKSLPMHIGYGYRKITSNLELAVRKNAKPLTATPEPQK